jgi:DNA processing protein
VTDVAWVALSLIRGMGGGKLATLADYFGNAAAVFAAPEADLLAVRGVGRKTAQAIRETDLDAVTHRVAAWTEAGVQVLLPVDFPPRLQPPLPEPPATLFLRGTLPPNHAPAVSIVGTRAPSPPMRDVAYTLGRVLAAAGSTVVSGLALGVDGAAHEGALSVPTGRTVAVLGAGVLNVYPEQHRQLATAITERGALVCEVAPDATVAVPWLVARNRLISALSDVVVVVQTNDDGGAMHAARAALKQGRRLVVVDNAASGNRALLDAGDAVALQADLGNLDRVL